MARLDTVAKVERGQSELCEKSARSNDKQNFSLHREDLNYCDLKLCGKLEKMMQNFEKLPDAFGFGFNSFRIDFCE